VQDVQDGHFSLLGLESVDVLENARARAIAFGKSVKIAITVRIVTKRLNIVRLLKVVRTV
jgi:hypothetical protein